MTQEDKDKSLAGLNEAVESLKANQKKIMSILSLHTELTNKDLKVVKWAYHKKFKMLQHNKHTLSQKKVIKH